MKALAWQSLLAIIVLLSSGVQAADDYKVRGKTMVQVKAIYGEPVSTKGPIGGFSATRPPITEWQYDGFYITFENNIALHGNDQDSLKLELNR